MNSLEIQFISVFAIIIRNRMNKQGTGELQREQPLLPQAATFLSHSTTTSIS